MLTYMDSVMEFEADVHDFEGDAKIWYVKYRDWIDLLSHSEGINIYWSKTF